MASTTGSPTGLLVCLHYVPMRLYPYPGTLKLMQPASFAPVVP